MALAENSTSAQPEKTIVPQEPPSSKPDKKNEKPSMKVIVRRLPPGITQEEFLTQVSPVPDHDYIYTVRGDMSLGENAFSRVYMNFRRTDDVYMFKEKFDNYVFVDAKGHEYPAVVEYASFQKVPKRRKQRPDPKTGSVETDPIYLEFLESLKEQPNQEEKPEYSYQPSTIDKNDITTPLLDFLKQRKIDRLRVREEKREERRKKEVERKKIREDDRRKRLEEKVPPKKHAVLKETKDDTKKDIEKKEEKPEEPPPDKPERTYSKKERKFEKPIKKYPKYEEKKDYKARRDDYRDYHRGGGKYEEGKKFEGKEYTKKVKKYSERREERKNEQKKEEVKVKPPKSDDKDAEKDSKMDADEPKTDKRPPSRSEENSEDGEMRHKNKENDPRMQRRIRNKDRPAMVLYKPGMLRKKSVDNDKDGKDSDGKGDREENPSSPVGDAE